MASNTSAMVVPKKGGSYLEGKVVMPPVFSSEKSVGSGIDTPFLFTKRLEKN